MTTDVRRQGRGTVNRWLAGMVVCASLGLARGAAAQQEETGGTTSPLRAALRAIAANGPRLASSGRANNAAVAPVDGSSILGTVLDASGKPAIVGVTIRSLTTNSLRSGTSDASGAFEIQNLQPGSYRIRAGAAAYGYTDTDVVVAPFQHLSARLRLPGVGADNASAADAASAAVPAATTQSAPATATPAVDNQTPFAFGDFTWLNGSPRNKKVAFDSPFFTPEVRFDTHFMQSFNHPSDHTLGGSTESFRSGEIQEEQISVGGDFHMDNVRGRVLYMMGLFSTTTPRNDASPGVGQWQLDQAYKNVSEAYGGYHFDVQHGLNVDAGIFVSYIGLFSYYNFDNWTYQPSYVSSNTPWFFNGLRVQWFPTNKLKIEPWLINGWQTYGRPNGRMGVGGQILYQPEEWIKLVFNNYTNGADAVGIPDRKRFHTDDSIELRYYNKPESSGLSKAAMSFTADFGCEYGGGVKCHGGDSTTPSQYFAGWMVYNRFWFNKDKFAITPGGGRMTNPGRYLTLLPPINGATAFTGTPYFTEAPGDQAHQWDATLNFQYMPKDFITFWGEIGYRHSDVPYFSGRGGITPPGGNNGSPQYYTCMSGATAGTNDLTAAQSSCGGAGSVWFPDLRKEQTVVSTGLMVKF